jgi:hypothetical protein
MQSDATTVDAYLAELPEDRRGALSTLRDLIRANLPAGYDEIMQYGMISYVIPLATYPDTYNGQPISYIGLASQKRHMALYLNGVYSDAEADFRARYEATGKKLDMGKSCVRFTALDQLPLEVVAEEVARVEPAQLLAHYEDARASSRRSG